MRLGRKATQMFPRGAGFWNRAKLLLKPALSYRTGVREAV
jgi:hypothetical protein